MIDNYPQEEAAAVTHGEVFLANIARENGRRGRDKRFRRYRSLDSLFYRRDLTTAEFEEWSELGDRLMEAPADA